MSETLTETLPVPEAAAIKANLVRIAHELGFSVCRVAPAGPARHADRFRQWVEDACYGDMAWLAKRVSASAGKLAAA